MDDLSSSTLANTPALEPPPGVSPNFTKPYSLRPYQVATTSICLITATLVVAARFVAKFATSKRLQLEEYVSIFSWFLLVVYCIFNTVLTDLGDGRHQWGLPTEAFFHVIRLSNIAQTFYPPMIFAAKLLILIQYLRIFAPTRRGFTFWGSHVLIWTNLMFYAAIFFVVLFECTPREKIWNPKRQGTCVNINAVFITTGTWNVFSDLCILVLPIRAIWLLQMATRKKLQISAVFATGFFACVASVLRLYYSVKYLHTSDANFTIVQVGLWSQAEATIVIVCGALPFLPQFLRLARRAMETLNNSVRSRTKHADDRTSTLTSKGPRSLDRWHRSDDLPVRRPSREYIPLADLNNASPRIGKETKKVNDSKGEERRVDRRRTLETGGGDLSGGIMKSIRIETEEEIGRH